MKILAISGSLRSASINTAFCYAAARLAPMPLVVTVFTRLGDIPLFNPDLEAVPPNSVLELRDAIAQAHALLIASPEYAHGVSGVMKNALDWLVSFEGFIDKPVAVINTSPRASHAYTSLKEILKTMSARISQEASITIPLVGDCITEEAMISSLELRKTIQSALIALDRSVSDTVESNPIYPLG